MWTADKLVYRGEDDFIKAYQGSELVWYRDRNKIFYTSTDGSIITPYVGTGDEYGFGANIVSNTYSGGQGVILFDGNVTKIGREAFQNKTKLLSIDIPYGVTKINTLAFDSCENLRSIVIPDSVTEIGGHILSYCYRLSSIVLSSNITFLNTGICLNCNSLVSVTIPDSVVRIGTEVFMTCLNLAEVIVNSVVPPILDVSEFSGLYSQFYNNASGRKIKVPAASLQAYKTATGWSTYAADIIAQ